MKTRFKSVRRQAASAAAAIALSTFFVGAAVGPAMSSSTYNPAPAYADIKAA